MKTTAQEVEEFTTARLREDLEKCTRLPPWANRNPGLRELAHAKAIEAAVSGTAKTTMGEIFKAALVDLRRKKGNR